MVIGMASEDSAAKITDVTLGDTEAMVVGHITSLDSCTVDELMKHINKEAAEGTTIIEERNLYRVLNSLTRKGVIASETHEGKNVYSVEDGVEIAGKVARVPTEAFSRSLTDYLRDAINMIGIKGRQQNIIVKFFNDNPSYHNPNSLLQMLISFRVDAMKAKTVVDYTFGAYAGMQQQLFGVMNQPVLSQPQPMAGYGYSGYGQPYGQSQQQPPAGMQPTGFTLTPQGWQPTYSINIQQPSAQPQQQGQPQVQVIKTGEMRKVRRPIMSKDGKPMTDDEGNVLFEESEEPIVFTGGGGDTVTTMVLKSLLDERTRAPVGRTDQEKELERKLEEERKEKDKLRDESLKKDIEQARKESGEKLDGLVSTINKTNTDLVKAMTDSMEKMQHNWEDRFKDVTTSMRHERELAEARGVAGERPVVSIVKEVRKAGEDVRQSVESIAQRLYPGQPPQIGQVPTSKMEEDARKLREQGK